MVEINQIKGIDMEDEVQIKNQIIDKSLDNLLLGYLFIFIIVVMLVRLIV